MSELVLRNFNFAGVNLNGLNGNTPVYLYKNAANDETDAANVLFIKRELGILTNEQSFLKTIQYLASQGKINLQRNNPANIEKFDEGVIDGINDPLLTWYFKQKQKHNIIIKQFLETLNYVVWEKIDKDNNGVYVFNANWKLTTINLDDAIRLLLPVLKEWIRLFDIIHEEVFPKVLNIKRIKDSVDEVKLNIEQKINWKGPGKK